VIGIFIVIAQCKFYANNYIRRSLKSFRRVIWGRKPGAALEPVLETGSASEL
jgi:competence transcription factor ComK